MSNPFYTATSTPGTRAPGASAPMRAEFQLIQSAFDKMPASLSANRAVVVNAGGTGLTVSGGNLLLNGDLSTTVGKTVAFGGSFATAGDVSFTGTSALVLNVTGVATLQVPGASGTLLSDNNTVTGITNKGFTDATANTQAVGDASTKIATMAALQAMLPIGVVLPYSASTAPNSQWLLLAGQAISRSTYSALFALISTTYGTGDGSTTFNLPDMRGRVAAGLDNPGGLGTVSRITNAVSGITGTTLGAAGRVESQIFAYSGGASVTGTAFTSGLGCSGTAFTSGLTGHVQSASYNINGTSTGVFVTAINDYITLDGNVTFSGTVSGNAFVSASGSSSGATDTRTILPPTIILNYIIKAL